MPVGSTFRQLLYAIKFGSTNFLLSGRVNENSEVIYNREPEDRVQKVAPWLTLDDDAYPAVVDGKIVWIVDGYTTTDRFPGSERESFKTMTDDSLQDETGLRTLPTDEINYMRNSVKATVDAYDGTVTLYAWDDQDPILKAWSSAFPGTVKPKSDIPDELLEHLRYPEDMFKVQRYQFARYHVTDPQRLVPGQQPLGGPRGPERRQEPAAAVPDVRHPAAGPGARRRGRQRDPDRCRGRARRPTWSMTSTFVPYKRSNLAAYVSVDSDATSPTYGQMRVIDVIDEQQQGPGQVANAVRSDNDGRRCPRAVQPQRQQRHLRQPAHRPGGRRADVRRAGLRLALDGQRVDLPDPALRPGLLPGRRRHRHQPHRAHSRRRGPTPTTPASRDDRDPDPHTDRRAVAHRHARPAPVSDRRRRSCSPRPSRSSSSRTRR